MPPYGDLYPARKANRFQDLVIYIREPHPFLACRACRVAVPLSCIPFHFAELKTYNFKRHDIKQLFAA